MNPQQTLDNCDKPIDEILTEEIPNLLLQLEESMKQPLDYTNFPSGKKSTNGGLYRADGTGVSGCYIFFNAEENIYVGISRDLPRRIRNHFNGKTQFTSSFIYKIAKIYRTSPGAPLYTNLQNVLDRYKSSPRDEKEKVHETEAYISEFSKARDLVKKWSVAFVPIEDTLTLYLFEASAALHFNTYKYNSFRTH